MANKTLFTAETSSDGTAEASVPNQAQGRDEATVQIDIADTGTVQLWGRVSSRLSYILITTVTTSSLLPLARIKDIKLVITANNDTVDAELAY